MQEPEIYVNTPVEDITKYATLTLPAVTQPSSREDRLDQDKDITATAGGAAIAGIGDLSNGVLRYVLNIAMTHMVSPAAYGLFGEIYTVAFVIGWIAKLGLDGVLICLLPTYLVKGERDLAAGLIRLSKRATLISGLLLGTLFFAFASVVSRLFYQNLSYKLPLQEVAPLIPLMALQPIFASGLQAFKEIKWKIYVDRLSQPVITLISMLVFYLLGWRMEALTFSTVGGFVCSAFIGQIVFSKVVRHFTHDAPARYMPWEWGSFAIPIFFNGLIYGISNSTDILFLSIFSLPAHAGIYIAADRISNFVTMPLLALNMIFLPLITEYYVSEKYEQLARMFKLVTKWALSLSLPVFLCCLVFHNAILGIFGPQYKAGGLVLVILCLGNLANSGTGSVLQMLAVTRHLRLLSINSVITIIANLGLSFILIQRFDILGAALAAALAVVLLNALCLIEIYWIMKIHPYRWDICKPLIAGGAASLVGILLLRFIPLGSGRFAVVEELGVIVLFTLIYILVMVLLRISKEDRIVLDAMLARFSKTSKPVVNSQK